MISKKQLFILAFVEGFLVMILEMIGKNVLTPFFGNSLTIWTIVIGNTFFFLSLGYFLANYFEKSKKIKLLKKLFILLTCWVFSLQILAYLILPIFIDSSIYLGATICHILLFGPLFTMFGIIPPTLIALYEEKMEEMEIGKNTALIFFVSTTGGILASLLITCMFVSNIEIHQVFLTSGFIVFSILLLYFEKLKGKLFVLFTLMFVFNLFFSNNLFFEYKSNSLIYHSNDLYGDLKIYDKIDNKIKNRFICVNNIAQSNIMSDFNVCSNWNYVHRISMFSSLKSDKNALLVGMGGGTIASELQRLNMKIDVVDIDKRMFEVAEKYYFFQNTSCEFMVFDARYYLNKNTKKYDLIVLDVLNGESQPNNLFTREGLERMKNSIKEDGMLIIEFQDLSDNSALAYKAISNTLYDAGLNVYISRMGTGLIDYVFIASPLPIDFSNLNPQKFTRNSINSGEWVNNFIKNPVFKVKKLFENSVILTDDLPILDKLCEKPRKVWRKNFINSTL